MIVNIIFYSVYGFFVFAFCILNFRSSKVCKFRISLIELIYKQIKSTDEFLSIEALQYDCIGSYDRMLWMFWRPLTMEEWLDEKTLNKLKPFI